MFGWFWGFCDRRENFLCEWEFMRTRSCIRLLQVGCAQPATICSSPPRKTDFAENYGGFCIRTTEGHNRLTKTHLRPIGSYEAANVNEGQFSLIFCSPSLCLRGDAQRIRWLRLKDADIKATSATSRNALRYRDTRTARMISPVPGSSPSVAATLSGPSVKTSRLTRLASAGTFRYRASPRPHR
jgi:hypothetical protein